MNEKKKFAEFVNNIKKEKLSGFVDAEKSAIACDHKLGFRLDHQGLNNDPSTKPHRIYIQLIKGGKSKCSRAQLLTVENGNADMNMTLGSSKNVCASVHCDDPEDDQKVRDGLIKSFNEGIQDVVV